MSQLTLQAAYQGLNRVAAGLYGDAAQLVFLDVPDLLLQVGDSEKVIFSAVRETQ